MRAVLNLLCFSLLASPQCLAADWGYDDQSTKKAPSPQALKAMPAQALNSKPAVQPKQLKPSQSNSTKTPKTTSSKQPPTAVNSWLALFDLVSKERLSAEQKDRFRQVLTTKLSGENKKDVSDILEYWPKVQAQINGNEDAKNAFASLFRSLLRYEIKSKNGNLEELSMVSEILGPERISVPGDPPLTEDSVDAYGDMACFLYEQAHPGKSVDAVDNRAIFASVIANKFTDAPTDKDKRAMANFALTWAKFKVMWLSADAADRSKLLKQVASGKPPADDSKVDDALVDLIFAHGPWHKN